MSVDAALPSFAWNSDGLTLTFVVPALGGCNLDCAYCFIAQRGEDIAPALLSVEAYRNFVQEVAYSHRIANLCIQGYEPLLPGSFPYTDAILSTGQRLGITTSLVTNGTHLTHWVDELTALAPGRISVSLDAAAAEAHDRQRRRQGAFAMTIDGLRRAAISLPAVTELVVTSVLIPKRRAQLDAMPLLLKEIGIKHWVVTALQKVDFDHPGGPIGEREKILANLRILRDHATDAGIDFKVDDEFDGLASGGKPDDFERNRIRRLLNPDGVYRLVPDGRCSKGADILKPLSDRTPRWDPRSMNPNEFIRRYY